MLHKTFKSSANEKDGDPRLDLPLCKTPLQTLSPPVPTGCSPELWKSHPAGMHNTFFSDIGGSL